MEAANLDRTVMRRWLHYLERATDLAVRRGNLNAIKMALVIARRRMKQEKTREVNGSRWGKKDGGFPITIFADAIKEMERRRGQA